MKINIKFTDTTGTFSKKQVEDINRDLNKNKKSFEKALTSNKK